MIVAFWLSAEDASRFAIRAKGALPPEELHVTMLYWPRPDNFLVQDVVQTAAAVSRGMTVDQIFAEVTGVGRFSTMTGEEEAFHLVVDSWDIVHIRNEMKERLRSRNIPFQENHPSYKPHITLSYLDAGDKNPMDRVDMWPLQFKGLTVAYPGAKIHLPFRTGEMEVDIFG